MEAVSKTAVLDHAVDPVSIAKRTIRHEANSLQQLADRLDDSLREAVLTLESCQGSVIVTGIGKAGLVGRKVSATFCSTGTKSYFLHAAEAIHGDLGRVCEQDHVLAFSMSGETEELTKVLPALRRMSAKLVAITGSKTNSLARQSDVVIALGAIEEADPNKLAPSTSTTAMMAVGDAIAFAMSQRRGFRETDFVRFHPGGSLGRKLTKVQELMRPLSQCRIVLQTQTVRESCITVRGTGRRTGAVMIVDEAGKLIGIFTDSDLARLLEKESTAPTSGKTPLELTLRDVMTGNPRTIAEDSLMPAAIELLAQNQISELPVVDAEGRPQGLVDITDVLAWFPNATEMPSPISDQVPDQTSDASDQASPQLIPFPQN